MEDKEEDISKKDFVGFRIALSDKRICEKYAREHGFSLGNFFILAGLLHAGAKAEAGRMLINKETKK